MDFNMPDPLWLWEIGTTRGVWQQFIPRTCMCIKDPGETPVT